MPIFKKGDPSQAHNNRSISMLPAMCKLFERILTGDIYDHLSRNHRNMDLSKGVP